MTDKRMSRCLYFTEPRSVEIRTEPLRSPDPGEILLSSRLIGISHGTEMLLFEGNFPEGISADTSIKALQEPLRYPLKYGYVNVAEDANGRLFFAFQPHEDLFWAAPEDVFSLSRSARDLADISADDGIFLAAMETAVNLVHDLQPLTGETIAVIGLGMIGLLTLEVLKRSHFGPIVAIEPIAKRRNIALESLRSRTDRAVLDPSDPDFSLRLEDFTRARGLDKAIHTSGTAAGLQTGLDHLGFRGKLVEGSWFGSQPLKLDLGSHFHRNRLKIVSSQVSSLSPRLSGAWTKRRRLEVVLDLLDEVRPSRWISHRFPLSEAQQAYDLIQQNSQDVLQVVLEPNNSAWRKEGRR